MLKWVVIAAIAIAGVAGMWWRLRLLRGDWTLWRRTKQTTDITDVWRARRRR